MYRKECLQCGKFSYRKNNQNKWLCPFCRNDLTDANAVVVEDKNKLIKGYFKKIK